MTTTDNGSNFVKAKVLNGLKKRFQPCVESTDCLLSAAFHPHFKLSWIPLSLCLVTKMFRVYALRYSRKGRLLSIARSKPILTAQAARVHLPMTNFSAKR